MRMLDKGTAEIDWRVSGGVAVFSGLSVKVKTVLTMNLLTGRVTSLKWVQAGGHGWRGASAGAPVSGGGPNKRPHEL
jgi:hypothetical protein